MSTKERAAAIRKALKAEGWNARQVSVRTDYYSMGSSIYATIRDASVDTARVTEIAEALGERIDRDQWGEILGGGNTFVHVDHSSDVRAELRSRYFGRGTGGNGPAEQGLTEHVAAGCWLRGRVGRA